MSSTQDDWKSFFVAAGIPEESANEYAAKLVAAEITTNLISVLDLNALGQLGITNLSHKLTILKFVIDNSGIAPVARSSPEPSVNEQLRGIRQDISTLVARSSPEPSVNEQLRGIRQDISTVKEQLQEIARNIST